MALAVLDASVVIAFRDPADALHARAVAAFRSHRSDELVLPASVYAQVLVGVYDRRKCPGVSVESAHPFSEQSDRPSQRKVTGCFGRKCPAAGGNEVTSDR